MTQPTTNRRENARSTISPGEAASVCAHYDIGEVRGVMEFRRGSRRSPKALLETSSRRYLLKRRPRGRDDPFRVAMTHEIVLALAAAGFPAARLIGTRAGNNSMVQLNGRVYELFEFVEGEPFDRTAPACRHAGELLARMHDALDGLRLSAEPPAWTYHDDEQTRARLRRVEERGHDVTALRSLYRRAAVEAAQRGDSGPRGLLHGDWHPGNMIFAAGRVVAVVDFDAARAGARLHDVANGALQFALTRVGLDADAWPDGLDAARFAAFLEGYASVGGPVETAPLPGLMAEAIVAEVATPVAETGAFGGLDPAPFLRMAGRKAGWILDHGSRLAALAGRSMAGAGRPPG